MFPVIFIVYERKQLQWMYIVFLCFISNICWLQNRIWNKWGQLRLWEQIEEETNKWRSFLTFVCGFAMYFSAIFIFFLNQRELTYSADVDLHGFYHWLY